MGAIVSGTGHVALILPKLETVMPDQGAAAGFAGIIYVRAKRATTADPASRREVRSTCFAALDPG
jgi:hypothetical protein